MTAKGPRDISGLIAAWGDGDEQALRSLMSAVYPELRAHRPMPLGPAASQPDAGVGRPSQ